MEAKIERLRREGDMFMTEQISFSHERGNPHLCVSPSSAFGEIQPFCGAFDDGGFRSLRRATGAPRSLFEKSDVKTLTMGY